MGFSLYDRVVLKSDLPHQGLKAGEVGTIIEVYGPNGFEVDFVDGGASLFSDQIRRATRMEDEMAMKKWVDVAETLVEDADKLPNLVFDKEGKLVSDKPSRKQT